jgi:hypothetical protein
VKDPDTFDGRRALCSVTRLVWIKIDANYFACAVGDCFWRLHCVGQAYGHPKVNHPNTGQPAGVVHVGNAGYLLRQIRVCELGILWAVKHIILGGYDKERGGRLYCGES